MITVVVGLQFGDEGKGKITDFLADRHDYAVRYNGGGNAGHTVVTEKETVKFHLVPSGALRCGNVMLSNGMVIDPCALVEEIKKLRELNPSIQIEISKNAHVVTDLHKYLDLAEEEARKDLKIGTTAQGIGPTYEDKYGRSGIRMADLSDRTILKQKLRLISRLKRSLIEGSEYGYESKIDDLVIKLNDSWEFLKSYIVDSDLRLQEALKNGKNIMFEGAHGCLLDIDFGVYPFVTSSNTIAGAITIDSGFSFRKVDNVVGVAKAYVSKVGNGPFPTELTGKDAETLRRIGSEYGTTTGRPRRVGWLDIPALRYALRINDADQIALTRVDTLGKLPLLKVGIRYTLDGQELTDMPSSFRLLEKVQVEYKELQTWGEFDSDAEGNIKEKGFSGFPSQLRDYVSTIESLAGTKVGIVSYGNRREMTVQRDGEQSKSMDQII